MEYLILGAALLFGLILLIIAIGTGVLPSPDIDPVQIMGACPHCSRGSKHRAQQRLLYECQTCRVTVCTSCGSFTGINKAFHCHMCSDIPKFGL